MTTRNYLQSLTDDKCDVELGITIRELLLKKGLENPYDLQEYDPAWAYKEIEGGIAKALKALGFNPKDESMQDTPKRYACMVIGELTKGLSYENFPKCTTTPTPAALTTGNQRSRSAYLAFDQMVISKNNVVMSLCEHHLQTIDGFCNIAYIPNKKLLGLSKFARVVEFFSRRPQVQERLTAQIFWALAHILDTENIAINLTATHYCMRARGAMQHSATTTTNKCGGVFLDKPEARQEFFHAI